MEERNKRKQRFLNNPPIEVIGTLLNSVNDYLNNEIQEAQKNRQLYLMILGIHAVALTVSEIFFGLKGLDGYKTFLAKFVDGNEIDTKFSNIAKKIHNFRNKIAHQWLCESSYYFEINESMSEGFIENSNGITVFNPNVYCNKYLEAFSSGKIFNWHNIVEPEALEQAKNRFLRKYLPKNGT